MSFETLPWMPANRTPVHCVQLEPEFDSLLALLRDLRPAHVLEIGSHAGGTLYHLLRMMPIGGVAVSVSKGARDYAGPWANWAYSAGVALTVRDDDSRSKESLRLMQAFAPYDFIFVDGGHEWDAVSADWDNVRGLVAPGGMVAFHDITPHLCRPDEVVDVPRLWEQIKAEGHRVSEFITAPNCCCGIGVVHL